MTRDAPHHLALCGPGCQSRQNGLELNAAVLRGTSQQVCRFLPLCSNLQNSRDRFGRTPLHIAASLGRLDVISWLLDAVKSDPNVKDLESGWTALHRAAFYGQLAAMRLLLRCPRVNAFSLDREGRCAFDLLLLDLPRHVSYNTTGHGDAYAWGDSSNFGHAGEPFSRRSPELVELFARQHRTVRKIVLSPFHVVYLTSDGRLFACGHGTGGRLGTGDGKTLLTISPIKLPSDEGMATVLDVGVGDDHTLILTEAGAVYSCGLNEFGALGHSNVGSDPSCRYLKPRPVKLRSGKAEERVTCIAAGRYHSVLGTASGVYTFGLNAGQLGHAKGDKLHSWPRVVAGLSSGAAPVMVAASVGATAVYTKLGDVYALHRYECKKLARWADVQQLCVSGGQLDTGVFAAGGSSKAPTSGADDPLVLAVIVGGPKGEALDYHLALWQASCPGGFRRVRWVGPVRVRDPVHAALSPSCLALVTLNGEGYAASMASLRVPTAAAGKTAVPLAEELCELSARRLPGIYRGVAIAQDRKAKNFAVIQAEPGSCLTKVPYVEENNFALDIARLLETGELHDVIVKFDALEQPCHRVVLMASSDLLRSLFSRPNFSPPDFLRLEAAAGWRLIFDCPGLPRLAAECLLEFLYRGSCRLLWPGFRLEARAAGPPRSPPEAPRGGKKSKKGKKETAPAPRQRRSTTGDQWSSDPIRALSDLARRLGVRRLEHALQLVTVVDHVVQLQGPAGRGLERMPRDEASLTLCDAVLVSELDGLEVPAHRCLLAARLEYFRLMFAHDWQESEAMEPVRLHLPGTVVSLIVEFVYSDDLTSARADPDNAEALCALLGAAEVYQSRRLKELCEELLAARLTFRDCPEILEVADFYSAPQLKTACFDFLHLNAAAMLEGRQLEGLSDHLMEELKDFYLRETPAMARRRLGISCEAPTAADLALLDGGAPGDGGALEPFDLSESGEVRAPGQATTSARRRKRRQAAQTRDRRFSASSDDVPLSPAEPPPEEVPEVWELAAEDFPPMTPEGEKEEEEEEEEEEEAGKNAARRTRFRPFSQREQKKMAAAAEAEKREKKKDKTPQTPVPPSCPWAPKPCSAEAVPAKAAPVSLRDVMRSQEVVLPPSPRSPTAPVPTPSPRIRTASSGSPWAELPSPRSAAPPAASASASSPPPPPLAFADIVREQTCRQETAVRLSSRPLALIQIEERALAELRAEMAALAASGDLNVRVECVPPQAAPPVWRAKV